MKIAQFLYDGKKFYGIVEGANIRIADGSPFTGLQPSGRSVALADVRLLPPCMPGKAVCIGLNYRGHINEVGLSAPKSPVIFIKPSTSVVGPFDYIEYPSMSKRVDYEAELVVVIGKKARNVPESKALDHVLGYTCGNDVTARDLQPTNGQWTIAKSFDTFLPFGPWIETDIAPSGLKIRTLLNGEERQSSNTSNLIFAVPTLVAYISSIMTLEPGDIIMTGTPSGIGPMVPGDEVVVEIEGIGSLVNHVR